VLHPAGYTGPADEPEPAQRDGPGIPHERRPRYDGGRPAAAHVGRHTRIFSITYICTYSTVALEWRHFFSSFFTVDVRMLSFLFFPSCTLTGLFYKLVPYLFYVNKHKLCFLALCS
jgi:hypothetical protein